MGLVVSEKLECPYHRRVHVAMTVTGSPEHSQDKPVANRWALKGPRAQAKPVGSGLQNCRASAGSEYPEMLNNMLGESGVLPSVMRRDLGYAAETHDVQSMFVVCITLQPYKESQAIVSLLIQVSTSKHPRLPCAS